MRTFSIRVDEELYQRLEKARGKINKADYIRDLLEENLREPQENRQEPQENPEEPQENKNEPWENRAQQYVDEIVYLRSENSKLLALLNQAQVLQMQAQQHLLPDMNTKEEIKKPWWKFWEK